MQVCLFTDGHFTRRQLSKALEINDNVADTVLERFRDAGLIKEGARTRGAGGGVDLVRQPSPFWAFTEAVCEEVLGEDWRKPSVAESDRAGQAPP